MIQLLQCLQRFLRNDCYYLEPSSELPEEAPVSTAYEAPEYDLEGKMRKDYCRCPDNMRSLTSCC